MSTSPASSNSSPASGSPPPGFGSSPPVFDKAPPPTSVTTPVPLGGRQRSMTSSYSYTPSKGPSFVINATLSQDTTDKDKVTKILALAQTTFARYNSTQLESSIYHTVLVLTSFIEAPLPKELAYLTNKLHKEMQAEEISPQPISEPSEGQHDSPTIQASFLSTSKVSHFPCKITSDSTTALVQKVSNLAPHIRYSLTYFKPLRRYTGTVPVKHLVRNNNQTCIQTAPLDLTQLNPTDLRDFSFEERKSLAHAYVSLEVREFGALHLWKQLTEQDREKLPSLRTSIDELLPSPHPKGLPSEAAFLDTHLSIAGTQSPKEQNTAPDTSLLWNQPGLKNCSLLESAKAKIAQTFEQQSTNDIRNGLQYNASLIFAKIDLQELQKAPHHLILVLSFLAKISVEATGATLLLLAKTFTEKLEAEESLENEQQEHLSPPPSKGVKNNSPSFLQRVRAMFRKKQPAPSPLSTNPNGKTNVTFVLKEEEIKNAAFEQFSNAPAIPIETGTSPFSRDIDENWWGIPKTSSIVEVLGRFLFYSTYRGVLPSKQLYRFDGIKNQVFMSLKELAPFLTDFNEQELSVNKEKFHSFPPEEKQRVAALCIKAACPQDLQLTALWESVKDDYSPETLQTMKTAISNLLKGISD